MLESFILLHRKGQQFWICHLSYPRGPKNSHVTADRILVGCHLSIVLIVVVIKSFACHSKGRPFRPNDARLIRLNRI